MADNFAFTINERSSDDADDDHHHPENAFFEFQSKNFQAQFGSYKKHQLIGEIFQAWKFFQESDEEIGCEAHGDNPHDSASPEDPELVAEGDRRCDGVDRKDDVGHFHEKNDLPKTGSRFFAVSFFFFEKSQKHVFQ